MSGASKINWKKASGKSNVPFDVTESSPGSGQADVELVSAPVGACGIANVEGADGRFADAAHKHLVNELGKFNLTDATTLTLDTNGAITVTQSLHLLDTFEAAASDDLIDIAGGATGDVIILTLTNASHNVVLKHGQGSVGSTLFLPGATDITLDAVGDMVWLYYVGPAWLALPPYLAAKIVLTHDHTGDTGDGGQLDHGAALTGQGDDDHPQYGQLADAEQPAGLWRFLNGLEIGDANFFLSIVSSKPRITFASGNYLEYDRTNDSFDFFLASTEKVAIDGWGLKVPGGLMSIGDNDVTEGLLYLYGDGGSSAAGGRIQLHMAADHDGTVDCVVIRVNEDDLEIRSLGGNCIVVKGDTGNVEITNDLTVANLITGGLVDGVDIAARDHAKYTGAEAITAVEAEATLDLAGDVTLASSKSLTADKVIIPNSVDVIELYGWTSGAARHQGIILENKEGYAYLLLRGTTDPVGSDGGQIYFESGNYTKAAGNAGYISYYEDDMAIFARGVLKFVAYAQEIHFDNVLGAFFPLVDSQLDLGTSSHYWENTYSDKLYLNATAILDGATAGHVLFTGDLVPATDDTEWVGQLESPYKAIKGLVIKDTTDGKHYKLEVISGTITATALD